MENLRAWFFFWGLAPSLPPPHATTNQAAPNLARGEVSWPEVGAVSAAEVLSGCVPSVRC